MFAERGHIVSPRSKDSRYSWSWQQQQVVSWINTSLPTLHYVHDVTNWMKFVNKSFCVFGSAASWLFSLQRNPPKNSPHQREVWTVWLSKVTTNWRNRTGILSVKRETWMMRWNLFTHSCQCLDWRPRNPHLQKIKHSRCSQQRISRLHQSCIPHEDFFFSAGKAYCALIVHHSLSKITL